MSNWAGVADGGDLTAGLAPVLTAIPTVRYSHFLHVFRPDSVNLLRFRRGRGIQIDRLHGRFLFAGKTGVLTKAIASATLASARKKEIRRLIADRWT